MCSMYRRRLPLGFGNQPSALGPPSTRSKPLKRPRQARAKFTVQAIYDAFVRIWRAEGWSAVSTRSVALETGISVGTLYDYFPSREALLSGYVRHCMEALLDEIEVKVIQAPAVSWHERMQRLVRLTCSLQSPDLPYFDAGMLQLESVFAEPKHHRRVFEELSEKWIHAVDACTDHPGKPEPDAVRAMFTSVWGAKRYLLLLDMDPSFVESWTEEMVRMCSLRFAENAASGKSS
jgi:AcrR family transcriptional regulator